MTASGRPVGRTALRSFSTGQYLLLRIADTPCFSSVLHFGSFSFHVRFFVLHYFLFPLSWLPSILVSREPRFPPDKFVLGARGERNSMRCYRTLQTDFRFAGRYSERKKRQSVISRPDTLELASHAVLTSCAARENKVSIELLRSRKMFMEEKFYEKGVRSYVGGELLPFIPTFGRYD